MQIIPISVELLDKPESPITAYRKIEEAGRTCYKSHNKNASEDITKSFIKGLIQSGHTSVLEHLNISFRIVCDRGTSHQLVRHRHIAISQQSTRYVDSKDLEVIQPLSIPADSVEYKLWYDGVNQIERAYNALLSETNSKDLARSVLPLCTKTELILTANAREWRHIIEQRSTPHAHENIRKLASLILEELCVHYPVIFEDLLVK